MKIDANGLEPAEIGVRGELAEICIGAAEDLCPQGKAIDGYIFNIFLMSYNVPNVGFIY